jgi:hypothetical protein
VHCPRCGTENEPGDRFCSNCGATLGRAEKPAEQLPIGERIKRLVGTSRRSQLITIGTVVAIVVAIVAALALPANEGGEIPRDAYTIAANRICVNSKKEIGDAGSRALANTPNGADPGEYARSLVPIVAQWRVDFNGLDVPDDRTEQANALNGALLEVEVQASSLALAAKRGAADLPARAQRVDQLTEGVETAIANLGLDECAGIAIAPGAPAPG